MPIWIKADAQVQGRGRRAREWVSKTGNLFCSGLYPQTDEPGAAANLGFVAALAVADLVGEFVDPDRVKLKWPNDVLVNGLKCSGILLEFVGHKGMNAIIVGVGVNLTSHPEGTDYPATHILAYINDDEFRDAEPDIPTPDTALAILASRFGFWKQTYDTSGFPPIRKAWLNRAYSLPGPVTVRLDNEKFEGQAMDLGADGALIVELPDGNIRKVHAGDVYFSGL